MFEVGNVYRKGPQVYLALDDGSVGYLLTFINRHPMVIISSTIQADTYSRVRSVPYGTLLRLWKVQRTQLQEVVDSLLNQYRYRADAANRLQPSQNQSILEKMFRCFAVGK